MSKKYTQAEVPTKESLDSILIGDLVKINDWKRAVRVYGTSENFVLVASPFMGSWLYSVIEKRPSTVTHNNRTRGAFTCGPDHWIFGYVDGYRPKDRAWLDAYLASWESGETEFSRRAISINKISVRRCASSTNHCGPS